IGARLARGPAEPQAETRSAALATAVSHGPWSITVHRVRDNARGVLLELELRGATKTKASLAAQLRLARGAGQPVSARFWRMEPDGRLTVGFDNAPGRGKLALLARLPGAGALRLTLP
ncbi:MAG: hypothetical protein KC503_27225, partial [Myxococcales bacterium]|nr:hypothetical protein [Myxococcales bacterium]